MRFSTLALFIALPAAAYAAVTPTPQGQDTGNNQPSTGGDTTKANTVAPVNPASCIQQTLACVPGGSGPAACCAGLECKSSNGVLQCIPPPASD